MLLPCAPRRCATAVASGAAALSSSALGRRACSSSPRQRGERRCSLSLPAGASLSAGARTALATAEWRPSAPTTSRAVSVTAAPPRERPRMPGHAIAVEDERIEGEALAHLGAGSPRGVDEELVEQRAARAVDRARALELREAPAQDDRPGIEAHRGRRRGACRNAPRRGSPSAAAARRRAPGPGGWRACRSGTQRGRRRGPSGRGARGAVPSRRRRRGPRPR